MKDDKTDNPKRNYPDSDQTARPKHALMSDDPTEAGDNIVGLQTSTKSGKHSSVEKLAQSRSEFKSGRDAQPVDGAFGNDPDEMAAHKPESLPRQKAEPTADKDADT